MQLNTIQIFYLVHLIIFCSLNKKCSAVNQSAVAYNMTSASGEKNVVTRFPRKINQNQFQTY